MSSRRTRPPTSAQAANDGAAAAGEAAGNERSGGRVRVAARWRPALGARRRRAVRGSAELNRLQRLADLVERTEAPVGQQAQALDDGGLGAFTPCVGDELRPGGGQRYAFEQRLDVRAIHRLANARPGSRSIVAA